jgi:nucleotidyltransferase substrate binding protein (TIGR01987 family)
MELIRKKHNNLVKALMTLEKAIEMFKGKQEKLGKNPSCDEIISEYETYRDSMIKRFEYSFDVTWNYLKIYLENSCSAQLQTKGSRSTFREALKAGLLTEEDVILALEMIDSRNLTVHMYKEETADFIAKKIPLYFLLLKKCSNLS